MLGAPADQTIINDFLLILCPIAAMGKVKQTSGRYRLDPAPGVVGYRLDL